MEGMVGTTCYNMTKEISRCMKILLWSSSAGEDGLLICVIDDVRFIFSDKEIGTDGHGHTCVEHVKTNRDIK